MEKLTASLTALLLLLIVGCEEPISAPETTEGSTINREATLGGIHDQIAAAMILDNNWYIFVFNADGSGYTRLTMEPSGGPVWSPNGQQIAFDGTGGGNADIFVMNADGTNQQNLTNNAAFDADPDWSPNGRQIAFTSDRDGITKVFVMNADGTNPHALTDMLSRQPAWSPNGQQLLFVSGLDRQLYVINADGTGQIRVSDLEEPCNVEQPSWSPNGQAILFVSACFEEGSDIYVVDPDGSNQTNLTNNPFAFSGSPSWSHNGKEIVFSSVLNGASDLYIMNADGTGLRRLTDRAGDELFARWSHNSKQIAFVDRSNPPGLFVINADGTGLIKLSEDLFVGNDHSWR